MSIALDADYVVYGAGAFGMSFVDTLLTETRANIVLVDEHAQPGGHWNDAYAYVKLHQPSHWYGVNSRPLERSSDLRERASKDELLAYFRAVLDSFVSSGRVQYFPLSRADDTAARSFHSLAHPEKMYRVAQHAKIVDATYMKITVPSVVTAVDAGRIQLDEEVEFIPLNDLTRVGTARQRYVVLGAGKTAMDAVLWLLDNGVEAARITWVMPRDAWMYNRDVFLEVSCQQSTDVDMIGCYQAGADATSLEDYCLRLEKTGVLHRIDPAVMPTRHKGATVSPDELQKLRTVKDIVRLGRVRRIEREQLIFESGARHIVGSGAVFVDCTASGLTRQPAVPIFNGDHITLQTVAHFQPTFSAALIGHLEARGGTDAEKNALSKPSPHPETPLDELWHMLIDLENGAKWAADSDISAWLQSCRLRKDTSIAKYRNKCKSFCWVLQNFKQLRSIQLGGAATFANLTNLR